MSRYTTTIKNLIDNNFDFQLNSYPIFDENYRETLNNNILSYYYESEIGFETASLFRYYLKAKLNLIMPKYNALYQAQKDILDNNLLLTNVNLTERLQGNNSTQSSSTSGSTSNGKNLFQDTPQGNISQTSINNQTWATNLTLNNNSISDNSSSSGTGTNFYLKTILGNNGNRYNVDVLQDIENKFMNIDQLIINELNDLFMQIF